MYYAPSTFFLSDESTEIVPAKQRLSVSVWRQPGLKKKSKEYRYFVFGRLLIQNIYSMIDWFLFV